VDNPKIGLSMRFALILGCPAAAPTRPHTQREDYDDENCSDQLNPNECVVYQGD